MEYTLRDFIERQPGVAGFELYNITCKQLQCVIFGAEVEPYSWMPILNALVKDPDLGSKLATDKISGKSTPFNEINYWFMTLSFTS